MTGLTDGPVRATEPNRRVGVKQEIEKVSQHLTCTTGPAQPTDWLPPHLHLVLTADGSPTLSDHGPQANGSGERMHHSEGALSESIYVYEPALKWLVANSPAQGQDRVKTSARCQGNTAAVFIIGLGLGYLELLTAACWLKQIETKPTSESKNGAATKLRLISFEKSEALSSAFLRWVRGGKSDLHNQIAEGIAKKSAASAQELRQLLASLLDAGQWHLYADFGVCRADGLMPELLSQVDHAAILFDAYSPASSPDVWNQPLIESFMFHFRSTKRCVFATYASRTTLKHVLRSNRFTLSKRPGFASKRECTLAFRE